ncbi:MAG: 2Fe-2S ferredoxin [Sandaracinus sp.]|nr:2Fe-2S ferredoxin [Sandaracinus sp.]|tara:strand:- start:1320 stop:2273 length:954 start_codon:yes stop_codon:yes gene_type:complete
MIHIGRRLPPLPAPTRTQPDWVQADPRFIERASERAQAREGGGWCVLDASHRIGSTPRRFQVEGEAYVVYRGESGRVVVAPNACPHMGAELHEGRVEGDQVLCPWHGLALGPEGRGTWQCIPAHDDGALVWARLIRGERPTERPITNPRPEAWIGGVIRQEARCEAEDIVANRLDPWHGTHYHPHSFATLRVTEKSLDRLAVRVAYRALGALVVEVDCTFHAPTRRSIVMTITGGDGESSVVETHATPMGPGRAAVIEATLATSDRRGFGLAQKAAPLLRPFIERRAARLWVEDVAYAERRYAMRQKARRHLQLAAE